MSEAPRAPIGFSPEEAIQGCGNSHCVAMITASLKAGHSGVTACTAERQISAAEVPQDDYDKYESLRTLIANCPFGQEILTYYLVKLNTV